MGETALQRKGSKGLREGRSDGVGEVEVVKTRVGWTWLSKEAQDREGRIR